VVGLAEHGIEAVQGHVLTEEPVGEPVDLQQPLQLLVEGGHGGGVSDEDGKGEASALFVLGYTEHLSPLLSHSTYEFTSLHHTSLTPLPLRSLCDFTSHRDVFTKIV